MSEPPLFLHARRGLNAFGAAGALGGAGLSGYMTTLGPDPLWTVILWGFVLAFGAFGLTLALRVIDPRPALVMDDWGVKDRRSGVRAPWGAIRRVWVWRQNYGPKDDPGGLDWIALDVEDPDAVRPGILNQNKTLKAIARAMGAPPVLLLTHDLKLSLPEIVVELERRRQRFARD